MNNPFRYDRLPADTAFVDRETEVRRIADCICSRENLLVQGMRRIGKTSCLLRAARRSVHDCDAICFFADLSRYSSLADVTEDLLRNAIPELSSLGKKTSHWLATTVKGLILKPTATASLDAKNLGGPDLEVSFGVELRAKGREAHSAALLEVLDALDKLAARKRRKVAIMLDEFTFLEKIGPVRASWQLRSAIQHHQNLTYILAGSAQHLIDQMLGQDGPFYGMFGSLSIGPIPADEMTAWIDRNFTVKGIKSAQIGLECVRIAGSRTRDIIQLARRTFDFAASRKSADAKTVDEAFNSLLDDLEPGFQMAWSQLHPSAQAVLTAVASGHGKSLFSEPVRLQFGLGSTAEVSQICGRLTRTGKRTLDYREAVLVRLQTSDGLEHQFDNPFYGAWVGRLHRRINV